MKKKTANILLPIECTKGVQATALLPQYYRQSYSASPGNKNKQHLTLPTQSFVKFPWKTDAHNTKGYMEVSSSIYHPTLKQIVFVR